MNEKIKKIHKSLCLLSEKISNILTENIKELENFVDIFNPLEEIKNKVKDFSVIKRFSPGFKIKGDFPESSEKLKKVIYWKLSHVINSVKKVKKESYYIALDIDYFQNCEIISASHYGCRISYLENIIKNERFLLVKIPLIILEKKNDNRNNRQHI